jgi:hypothetical protein
MKTDPPELAIARAMANPMPPPAPVTIATFPEKSNVSVSRLDVLPPVLSDRKVAFHSNLENVAKTVRGGATR